MSQKELNAARNAYAKTKPWAPFFEARAKQNETQLERETAQQRETRLNRERNPPTVSAEVYEWDWSEEDPLSSFALVYPKNAAKILLRGMRLLNAATIPSRTFGMSVTGSIWMAKKMAIVLHR